MHDSASPIAGIPIGSGGLASLSPQLLDAALAERTPIDVVIGNVLGDELVEAASRTDDIEADISALLAGHGILPCRRISGLVPGLTDPIQKTLYYRPSEQLLFEALSDSHPILLATTVEMQRYVDCLTAYSNDNTRPRELWIWRGASGRDILERVDAAKPSTKPNFAVGLTSDIISKMDGERPDELVSQLKNAMFENGAISGTATRGDDSLNYWWSLDEDKADFVRLLVDDFSVGNDLWEALKGEVINSITTHLHKNPDQFPNFTTITRQTSGFVHVLVEVTRLPRYSILVVPDAHHFLTLQHGSPGGAGTLIHIGALKEAYHRLVAMNRGVKLVLLCGDLTLPKDLREEVLRLELPLPSRRELFVAIKARLGEGAIDEQIVRLSEEAAGMTLGEVQSVLLRVETKAGVDTFEERLSALRQAKRRHIARSPALELVETGASSELGGMEKFESWLAIRRKAFSEPELARRAGINRSPRGVLLLGIPGSGKSLAAKAISRDWQLPLVRLDMGALQDSWVGSSEARVREALRVIEAMAPCIMWIDEIDKGISQGDRSYTHSADLNIRATLLTWMQENRFPVFIVATANRFAGLPPELTRAGRFDARFFFGCPGPAGRRRIIDIHLRARGYDPDSFQLEGLVDATHGFTGAEIEQVVLDGLYAAFDLGAALSAELLLSRARETQPLIKSAGQGLEEVWDLVEGGRVEMASEDMLTRTQVARLIDPHLYRPIYCRMEAIEGFHKHHTRGDRFLMASPFGGPAAVVMETGESEWIYVQTNFRREPGDIGTFKLLDRFETLEQNFVFDTLLVEYALETILFESEALMKRFEASPMLSAYVELFKTV